MDFEALLVRSRSFRRFHESQRIEPHVMTDLVNLARRASSAANRQPLRYAIVQQPEACATLFPSLSWAGLLRDWGGPKAGERPAAYILILLDTTVSKQADFDVGIAAQTMQLAATERGLGGCMIGSINRAAVVEAFKIPERYALPLILALGVPAESCVLDEIEAGGSIAYYRDAASVHHVPKRPLAEVLLDVEC